MEHIGKRITNLRKIKGLTKAQCSKELGLHPSTLSLYELGKRKVNSDWLPKISGFFGVSTEYLLGITEYEKIYPAHTFDEMFIDCENKTISNGEFYIKLSRLNSKQKYILDDLVEEMITK